MTQLLATSPSCIQLQAVYQGTPLAPPAGNRPGWYLSIPFLRDRLAAVALPSHTGLTGARGAGSRTHRPGTAASRSSMRIDAGNREGLERGESGERNP